MDDLHDALRSEVAYLGGSITAFYVFPTRVRTNIGVNAKVILKSDSHITFEN